MHALGCNFTKFTSFFTKFTSFCIEATHAIQTGIFASDADKVNRQYLWEQIYIKKYKILRGWQLLQDGLLSQRVNGKSVNLTIC